MTGQCEDGDGCQKAHNLQELRVLPAVQMGLLDMDFKTELCPAYSGTRECPQGKTAAPSCVRVTAVM